MKWSKKLLQMFFCFFLSTQKLKANHTHRGHLLEHGFDSKVKGRNAWKKILEMCTLLSPLLHLSAAIHLVWRQSETDRYSWMHQSPLYDLQWHSKYNTPNRSILSDNNQKLILSNTDTDRYSWMHQSPLYDLQVQWHSTYNTPNRSN